MLGRTPLAPAMTLACVCALAGCSNSTTSPVVPAPSLADVAGDYSGTVQDNMQGNASATVTFAQHGASVGGTMTLAFSGASVNSSIAWTIDAANALAGSAVENLAAQTCTFSMSGSYSTVTNQISGTYSALSGCAGQAGNFQLTQLCSDPATSRPQRSARRTGVPHC